MILKIDSIYPRNEVMIESYPINRRGLVAPKEVKLKCRHIKLSVVCHYYHRHAMKQYQSVMQKMNRALAIAFLVKPVFDTFVMKHAKTLEAANLVARPEFLEADHTLGISLVLFC